MLSFIGGTGPEGLGLAFRFLLAGQDVVIGSRSEERAAVAANKLTDMITVGATKVSGRVGSALGLENKSAVAASDVVIITVPFSGQVDILNALRVPIGDKIVVDTVVPLLFAKGKISAMSVPEGSAAEQAQQVLPAARVVSAFQNLSAETLLDINEKVDCSVVVCGDDISAKIKVMDLGGLIEGIQPIDGGGIVNSRYVEDFTALLLNINRIYKAHSSIKIIGL